MTNIWVECLKNKFRFEFKGLISTEDLFDLTLADLDAIYKSLKKEESDLQGDSLLGNDENPKPAELWFAVPIEYFELLRVADELKAYNIELVPVPRNAVYSVQEQETKLVSDQIEQAIWKRSNKEVSGNGKGGTK